ncbi:MAG TPA: sugar ABC transporter substrate-binding protein [Oculatellaceae cyanobacterium]
MKSEQVGSRAVFKHRLGIIAGFCACILLVLSGCGTSNTTKDSVTLEFWTLQMDAFKDTLQPMFAEYERQHPGVRIHWVDVPFSEGPKRVLTAMMSSHVPDVVNLNPDFSAILANRQALVDMQHALPEEAIQKYLPVAWEAATLQKADGNQITFGLPWYITSSVTLYNQAILKKAGLSQPPSTFQELPAFAETIRKKTGAYGLMPMIADGGNFLKELQKMGIPLYNERGRASFATPRAVELLARYVRMYRDGVVPKESITEGHQAAVGRYQAGTLAMFSVGPNFLKIVKENAPQVYEQTGIAPQFPRDARFKDFSMMVLVVPRKSAHPKEAVEFAAFITNARNQLALAKAAPVLPSITEALADSYFTEAAAGDRMALGRKISAAQLVQAKEAYRIQPNQNAINERISYHVQMALLGRLSPETALQQAQQQINQILETEF